MKLSIKSLTLTAGLLWSGIASAQTQAVLTFDDLGPSPIGVHMMDGYDGFNWNSSNWHYMSLASAPDNTFLALSGTATAIVSDDGSDFYFDGADFWSRRGLDAVGRFYFILSHDGVVVYDGRKDPDGKQNFAGVPATFVPNYDGPVDVVAVVFTQGGKDWNHLAMDNFRITIPSPAPTPTPTLTPTPTPTPAPAPATTYKLTVKTSGKGSVAVSRTGNTFVAGQVLTLTATPAAGAPWIGWSGGVTSSSRSISITMTKSMTITANFK